MLVKQLNKSKMLLTCPLCGRGRVLSKHYFKILEKEGVLEETCCNKCGKYKHPTDKGLVTIICPECGTERKVGSNYIKTWRKNNEEEPRCRSCRARKVPLDIVTEIEVGPCRLFRKANSRCDKNIKCMYYSECLNEAAKLHWPGWISIEIKGD